MGRSSCVCSIGSARRNDVLLNGLCPSFGQCESLAPPVEPERGEGGYVEISFLDCGECESMVPWFFCVLLFKLEQTILRDLTDRNGASAMYVSTTSR